MHLSEPVDSIVFELIRQWRQDHTKQFVFGTVENGHLQLVVPSASSSVTPTFLDFVGEHVNEQLSTVAGSTVLTGLKLSIN